MGTIAHFADLRAGVVDALRLLARSCAGQSVIRVGAEACEVEWSPGARHHRALLLPLVLLTAAIDEGAARARWLDVSFAEVVDTAHSLDLGEKDTLLALAGMGLPQAVVGAAETDAPARPGTPWRRVHFARELTAWIERFDLAGRAVTVDRERLASGAPGAHYGVRPVDLMREMPAVLKALEPAQGLAALAVLALYNGGDARAAFKGKRRAALNPPAVEAFAALRRLAGEDAHAHLLRLVAAYRGW